jgi:tetratricopeptide (TPR) repeat protein
MPANRVPSERFRATLLASLLVAVVVAPLLAQDALINQARRLDLDGKQEQAIALYNQALVTAPRSFDAHYGIGRALDLAGRYDDARAHLTTAVALAPEETKEQALRMLGLSYTFVGNAREASTYFRQVYDRRVAAANFPGAAEVANELGRVYLELGDSDNAMAWYRVGFEVAARQTERPSSEIDLAAMRWAHAQARIAARRGNVVEARTQEAIVKALLDKGTNQDQQIQLPYLVGYDRFYLGDFSAAEAALRTADQDDPFVQVLLAQAYERLGDLAVARTHYQRVMTSSSHAVNNAVARPIARRKLAALP